MRHLGLVARGALGAGVARREHRVTHVDDDAQAARGAASVVEVGHPGISAGLARARAAPLRELRGVAMHAGFRARQRDGGVVVAWPSARGRRTGYFQAALDVPGAMAPLELDSVCRARRGRRGQPSS